MSYHSTSSSYSRQASRADRGVSGGVSRLRDRYNSDRSLRDKIRFAAAGVAVAATVAVATIGLSEAQKPKDTRTEAYQDQEKGMLTAFLTSGKDTITVDGRTITAVPGTVTITQDGSTPIHVRRTPNLQSPDATLGHLDGNTELAAKKVTIENPFMITGGEDGDTYIGGLLRRDGENSPVVATPNALAAATVYVNLTALEKLESGAHVEENLKPGEPFGVSFDQQGLQAGGNTLPRVMVVPASTN